MRDNPTPEEPFLCILEKGCIGRRLWRYKEKWKVSLTIKCGCVDQTWDLALYSDLWLDVLNANFMYNYVP
jgi:hypothetical protein